MTPKDTLKACIERAIKNGWNVINKNYIEIKAFHVDGSLDEIEITTKLKIYFTAYNNKHRHPIAMERTISDLFCDHSFMKAVFGSEMMILPSAGWECSENCGIPSPENCKDCEYYIKVYQYHQQQLIILPEDERIKYLERVLGE
jgi:hypothetical protein